MKRTRRKSLDLEEQDDRIKKKKEPRIDRWYVPQFLEKKVKIMCKYNDKYVFYC